MFLKYIMLSRVSFFFCLLVCLSTCSITAYSEHLVPIERIKLLKSGVNISPYSPDYQRKLSPERRLKGKINDFRLIKDLRFRCVRLPVVPDTYWVKGTTFPDHTEMAYLMDVVREAQKLGLGVVLDMHAETDLNLQLIKDKNFQNRFLDFYENFVKVIVSVCDPNKTFFELLNEPQIDKERRWFELRENIYKRVRAHAPKHTLILTGGQSAGDKFAIELSSDKNVIYTFHFYEPQTFTHAGMNWWGPFRASVMGTSMPYPNVTLNELSIEDQTNYVFSDLGRHYDIRVTEDPKIAESKIMLRAPSIEGMDEQHLNLIKDFFSEKWCRKSIEDRIRQASEWSKKNDVPLVITEFGAFRWGLGLNEQRRWIRDATRTFNKYGIGWMLWGFEGLIDNHGTRDDVQYNLIAAYERP
jgi:endoglucanase